MHNRRSWLAAFLLITFVVGGMVMPVLHRIDHASEWAAQQTEDHSHGEASRHTLDKECIAASADFLHCHFCQRHFFGDAIPDLAVVVQLRVESHIASAATGTPLSLDGLYLIRAPPVNA